MDDFSSARPNTEEGASQGAQYARRTFRHVSRFASPLHGVPNPTMRSFRVVSCFTGCPIPELRLCQQQVHRFRAGGQNQKWPTCGQNGYLTPVVSGIPTASERGDKIRSGPLVGKVATSPLPSRGSPPLQSGGAKSEVAHLWARWLPHPCRLGDPHRFRAGGQNQKGPTCGQNGYVAPAVSGIPTASERGARWLRHPCRLGDPHRFIAGG